MRYKIWNKPEFRRGLQKNCMCYNFKANTVEARSQHLIQISQVPTDLHLQPFVYIKNHWKSRCSAFQQAHFQFTYSGPTVRLSSVSLHWNFRNICSQWSRARYWQWFDSVDHSILLSVLSSRFSVVNTAFSWFQSYLSDRSQSFVYASSLHRPESTGIHFLHVGYRWTADQT